MEILTMARKKAKGAGDGANLRQPEKEIKISSIRELLVPNDWTPEQQEATLNAWRTKHQEWCRALDNHVTLKAVDLKAYEQGCKEWADFQTTWDQWQIDHFVEGLKVLTANPPKEWASDQVANAKRLLWLFTYNPQEERRKSALLIIDSTRSSVRRNLWMLLVVWLQWFDGARDEREWQRTFTDECRASILKNLGQLDSLRDEYQDVPEVQTAVHLDLTALLRAVYSEARESAARNRGMPPSSLPETCPWSWEQIQDRWFDPGMDDNLWASWAL
jgi:hypothetical protein